MQTQLIDEVFLDFQEQFQAFFQFCNVGFRNEFIINMLCRIFKNEDVVLNLGDKVRYIYFVKEGAMTLYNRQKKPTI